MILLKPRLSEKSYALSQKKNTYVFEVPLNTSSTQVKLAVEQQFKVQVVKVNVMNKAGKLKRSVRKRTQPIDGREKTTRRAYVTLKSGDKITLFEEA